MKEIDQDRALKQELEDMREKALKPGSPELENFLAAGYPLIGNHAHAREIIEGRDKDHTAFPWDLYMQAKAFEAALYAKPQKEKSPGRPATRE